MTTTYITITKLIAASHRTAMADTIAAYNAVAEAAGCKPIVGGFSRRASLAQYMESVLAELISTDHAEALEIDAAMTAEIESIRPNMACMTMTEIGQYLKECHAEALDVNAWIDDLTNKGKVCGKKLDAFCFQVRDEEHSEALEENKRFDWLHNRWCLFHSSSRLQQEEIIGVAWEQARHIIEADEVYSAQKQRKLEAIWKHTHQDYKGESGGIRSILVCRNGTISVPLEGLTDIEIEQRSSMWQRNK